MGSYTSSALSSTGRVFVWGNNQNGQLGDGTTIRRTIPTEITSNFPLLIGEKITQLSMGGDHSSVLTSNGRVFTWGLNDSGQLGDGTTVSTSSPIEITSNFPIDNSEKISFLSLGVSHSSAFSSNGRIFVWGRNGSGQLGDGTSVSKSIPIDIRANFPLSIDEKIVSLSSGSDHSTALFESGRIFVWGMYITGVNVSNHNGNISTSFGHNWEPVESTSNFFLNGDEIILYSSIGDSHLSFLSSLGYVYIFGNNSYGQIGNFTNGNYSNTPFRLIV
jgi:alpha-tubulin suppressor-like RCC1 family protein